MRYATASVAICFILSWSALTGAVAAPLDLNEVVADETPEALCDRLAPDPFAGFGPDEWGHPFRTVDFYRAVPACTEALANHPGEPRFALGAAMAYIAGKKTDSAKPLLDKLIAQGNTSAMLVLAYVSPEPEAADLMHQAADAGNANAMMLYGMALMTGKGVAKNSLDGVRMVRRAADAGSTRAMLLMANFYNEGAYGVGLNPAEAKDLIAKAAQLGDPTAKNILASLAQEGGSGTTPQ
jgi:hypothetical protein